MFIRRPSIQQTRLHWAVEFSPHSRDVIQILRKHWHLLYDIPGCDKFPETGYRRTQSLQDMLTKTNSEIDKRSLPKSIVVGHHSYWNCSICFMNVRTMKIDFPDLGFSHVLQHFSDCKTKMCVYLLICKCKLRYVGSTQRQLRVRLQEHRSHIKHGIIEAPLTQHCLDNALEFSDFQCIVLEVITTHGGMYSDLNKWLLQRETFWITRLKNLFYLFYFI